MRVVPLTFSLLFRLDRFQGSVYCAFFLSFFLFSFSYMELRSLTIHSLMVINCTILYCNVGRE
ncbi:hypothetical protein BO70DRAFT_222690 [Aspergillus heteromorphus CBS 117.55]|uniref:Uncharacterized protein n=1 Tax=Aspergillus heteromorphus CBS 117.55 TaxID=1448321 RepID=A0A317WMB8_9EURO|nr:uncharacterized protein BO70DRAFT_222690 [Aspergillus heteromorphus CBS 117.55]PWY86197.1 hypothetical protein BO70DRAFT_222690 [Aspergillus heteromorphus CBS 117.55]